MSARTKRWWLFDAESIRCPRTCFGFHPPSCNGAAARFGSIIANEWGTPPINFRRRETAGVSDGASGPAAGSSLYCSNMIAPFYWIFSVADFETLPYVAVIVTVCVAGTAAVEIWNEAVVIPAGTVSTSGICVENGALVFSVITIPPGGAGAVSVTTPVAATPPVTTAGEIVKLDSVTAPAGFTASETVWVKPG